jgi:hypothetical protein
VVLAVLLGVPTLDGLGFMVLGLVLVAAVRPDPRRIARMIGAPERGEVVGVAAPLAEILRRPGVLPALLAALASFAVMVGIMTLTGVVVVEQGHPARVVFPIIGAHVIGMYALVIVVGDLIDRIGRTLLVVVDAHDRQQNRLAAAAVHRLVPASPARVRMARTLRREGSSAAWLIS